MSLFHDAARARRLGLALAGLSALAAVVGMVLFVASGQRLAGSWMVHNFVGGLALAAAFAAMVHRQPHNAAVWTLGWAMVIQGIGQALLIGISEYALTRVLGPVGARGAAVTFEQLPTWLAWLTASNAATWVPGVVPLVTLALLLFPDGRLPSRRWWSAAALAVVGIGVFMTALALGAHPRPGLVVGEVHETSVFSVLLALGALLVFGAVGASIASLVVRYRRSAGDERRQIRWIALGGGLFGLAFCVWVVALEDLALAQQLFWTTSLIAMPGLFFAYAVAILRYRLYDIDVVISRSLVVTVLAGFIAATYVAVVVGVGRVVGTGEEPNLALQVVATAIVAVAFQPLRQRVRRWADGLVYGHRATPYEVLSQFSRQAANAGDETSLQRVADVLATGTGATPVTVWLRVGDQLRPAAQSDRSDPPAPVGVHGDEPPELEATLVVGVRHDGELLGAITLDKPRSDPLTPQHEELTRRVASGLGLVLRNARLTAELRAHLDELEASRQRIVHAQDEARRKIERDLHEGPQRQLVELQALLGLARATAEDADAAKTTDLLGQLVTEAEDTVATLRDLGRGIYPPLLEAEGLGPALAAQTRSSAVPVTLHAAGLGRYGREVEAAVYFCVLEALQNTAKYAGASSAHVRLEPHDGCLRFEVSDDGSGFDRDRTGHGSGLRGMADRLDTVAARLEIDSSPGRGTRVRSEIPVVVHEQAVGASAGAED